MEVVAGVASTVVKVKTVVAACVALCVFFGSFLEWLRRIITAESRRNCESINNRLEAVHKELKDDINTVKNDISAVRKELKDDINVINNNINVRLDRIENNHLAHVDADIKDITKEISSLKSDINYIKGVLDTALELKKLKVES
jgi:uncharacterized protein (UPF0335 family)